MKRPKIETKDTKLRSLSMSLTIFHEDSTITRSESKQERAT